MPSVTDFKGAFEALAKPTLFKVQGFGTGRQMEFLCKAAQLPASTLGVIEVPYLGRKIKIPGDRVYAEWTVTIVNDETFDLRKYFEDWVQKINHEVTNIGTPAVEAIKEDGSVYQLNNQHNTIVEYKIVGAFPTEVSPVDLSMESNDTVSEFTVNFAFDYFERI